MTEIAETAQQASGSTSPRSGAAMTAVLPGRMSEPEPPLSDLHAMLAQIERQHEAHFINRVVNDLSVYPWVKGWATGPLDMTQALAFPGNVCLMGEHGGMVFAQRQLGLYEAHTSILPSGRGAWALSAVRAMLHWMFTRSDAVEIVTRCPKGNLPARALARAIGGRFLFTNPRGWIKDLDPVPADIFSLTIQDWMKDAPGLAERGHWFHEKLEAEYVRHGRADPSPHDDDEIHDRYVGAACEMILGGQPDKGVVFYNRFAVMGGYLPVTIAAREPLTLDIHDALVVVSDGDFWVPLVREKEN